MLKRWGIIILFLLSISLFFGDFTINVKNTSIYVGESVPIEIETDQTTLTHLYVNVTSGGFDNPLILFDGFDLINGKSNLIFLAPLIPGESTITFFNEDNTFKKIITLKIIEETMDLPETKLIILEKRGNVLYKTPDSDIWDSLSNDTVIQENSELLTLKDGYVHLKEPSLNIEIKVSADTQLYIKRLRVSESGDIDIEYELKKGATVNKIKEILAPGSKYLVGSGSVVAGVRGTEFGFERRNGNTQIRTFEGTVYTMVNNQLFPVTAGNMFNYSPDQPKPLIQKLDKPLEEYENEIIPEEKKDSEETVTEEQSKEEKETPPKEQASEIKGNIGNISFGKQTKGLNTYLVYSFAPNLDFGPFGIGIGFNAYQENIDSPLYYGLPTDNVSPSTNILSALSINYFKLDFPSIYIRYGISPSYTKGLGLFMNNYYVPYSRVLDAELKFSNLQLGFHIPYEISSFIPFNYHQTSNVYFGYINANLNIFNAEITGVINLNKDKPKNDFNQAYLTTLYKDILFFRLGIETDVILTNDGTMVWGMLMGPTLNFPPFFQFMFGFNYISNGFNNEYLNSYYEYNSASGFYMNLENKSSYGLVGKSTLNINPYLNLLINYNKLFSEDRDSLLSGQMTLNIPSIGGMPQLTAGFSYMQYKFLEDPSISNVFLNDNTNLQGFIYYPVLENSGVIYSIQYNMKEKKFEYTLNFETKEF
ncbi:FecR family protein [Marinitoga arctica]